MAIKSQAQFIRRTFHELNALQTIDNEAVFFDVLRFGSWKVRRLKRALV